MTKLSIVVPCYNEEAVLSETITRLQALVNKLISAGSISSDSGICFVDDGSKDNTWQIIEGAVEQSPNVNGIKLAGNRGHQNALLAGLLTVTGDAVVSVDADLQDDISVIEVMVNEFQNGNDIVFGVRDQRTTDSFFKRFSAESFYRLLKVMGVDVVFNHADYRLMSRRAIEILAEYSEVNLFLRGVVTQIGLPSTTVTYDRAERFAGESKYNLRRMLSLALDGVTSFTSLPLRLIALLGISIFFFSLGLALWVIWVRFTSGDAVPGWASSVLPLYLLGGVQLFCIGVVGEYVAKIYMETKRRPRYSIEKIL